MTEHDYAKACEIVHYLKWLGNASKENLADMAQTNERECRRIIQEINKSTRFDCNVGWNDHGYFLVFPKDDKEIQRQKERHVRAFRRQQQYLKKIGYLEEMRRNHRFDFEGD